LFVSRIPGFQDYYIVVVDVGDGMHLPTSLYDNPSGAEQSTQNAASWRAENVAALFEGPPGHLRLGPHPRRRG
jgi:hypothetical protein